MCVLKCYGNIYSTDLLVKNTERPTLEIREEYSGSERRDVEVLNCCKQCCIHNGNKTKMGAFAKATSVSCGAGL